MLGGVMDFEFGGNAAGLGRRERFIQFVPAYWADQA